MRAELGDLAWYLARAATELGSTLEEITQGNLDKLAARQSENKLHGEGSSR